MRAIAESQLQKRRRDKRGDHDDGDDGGKRRVVDDTEAAADAGEDQLNFAARNHSDSHSEPANTANANGAGGEFAENGSDGEAGCEPEGRRAGERLDFYLHTHQDKINRHDESFERRKNLAQEMALGGFVFEKIFEYKTSGEGADDGGEADAVGEPGEYEGEAKTEKQIKIGDTITRKAAKRDGSDPQAESDAGDQKSGGAESDAGDENRADESLDDESRRGGEDNQAENVVDDGGAEDDARFGAVGHADVAKNAGADGDAGSGKNGADEEIRCESGIRLNPANHRERERPRANNADRSYGERKQAETLHFVQTCLEADEKQQKDYGNARELVNELVDSDGGNAGAAAENFDDAARGFDMGQELLGSLLKCDGVRERKIHDVENNGPFAKDGQNGAMEGVGEIGDEHAHEQFAEDRGLAEAAHGQAAKKSGEDDENDGQKDRSNRIARRGFWRGGGI